MSFRKRQRHLQYPRLLLGLLNDRQKVGLEEDLEDSVMDVIYDLGDRRAMDVNKSNTGFFLFSFAIVWRQWQRIFYTLVLVEIFYNLFLEIIGSFPTNYRVWLHFDIFCRIYVIIACNY